MFRFRLRELIAAKERALGRRLPRSEIAAATGVSVQVLSSLTSPDRAIVTNTAFVEGLCRYFACTPNELLIFEPPLEQEGSTHVDELYPNRRRQPEE